MPSNSISEFKIDGHDADASQDLRQVLLARWPRVFRPVVVIPASLAMATVAAFTARHFAPPEMADLAALAAAWIALYPIPCLKPRIPWWNHWLQGVFILGAFWITTRSSK